MRHTTDARPSQGTRKGRDGNVRGDRDRGGAEFIHGRSQSSAGLKGECFAHDGQTVHHRAREAPSLDTKTRRSATVCDPHAQRESAAKALNAWRHWGGSSPSCRTEYAQRGGGAREAAGNANA